MERPRGTSFGAEPLAVAGDIRVSLYRSLSEMEEEWRGFEQRADCTVFQTFGWLSSWHSHIGMRAGVRPVIVVGRGALGEIVFMLPLAVEPRGIARTLTWLGSETSDYNAPLLAPEFPQVLGGAGFASVWLQILESIQSQPQLRFDLIRFTRMPAKVGAQPNPFVQWPVTVHPSGAYSTRLTGDWETFYRTKRSKSTRQRDRTKRHRLEALGAVRFVSPQEAGDLARTFDVLQAQKSRSFAAMGVGNVFDRAGHADFYRSLALDPAARYIAHVSRLDVGDAPAAVNLGLRFRGCYYHVLASYADGEIARFGPGAAHLHELMRDAIENGCTVFDFTVGDEPYKRDWSDTQSELFDLVQAVRWRGALVAAPLMGGIKLKRIIKQTPLLWRGFTKARAMIGALRNRPKKPS